MATVAIAAVVVALVAGVLVRRRAESDSTFAETGPLRTVAVPAERLSPFCESIADLDERLNAAPADADTSQMIIEAYSSMVDLVPEEIRNDFLSVLAALQADPAVPPPRSPPRPTPRSRPRPRRCRRRARCWASRRATSPTTTPRHD